MILNFFSVSEVKVKFGGIFVVVYAVKGCWRCGGMVVQGGDRWVKLHEESLDFHPRFFPVFEEKREN